MTIFRALLLSLFMAFAAQADTVSFDHFTGFDVVLLGEVHDNPDHHLWQAEALSALAPAAVVFEMLSPDQAALHDALRDDVDGFAMAANWASSGWPDFTFYRPVFAALGNAQAYGAALPRDAVRGAVSDGAAAHFPGDPALFGLITPLPGDQQITREAMQMSAHCDALPQHMLGGMVAAQRLRDAELARQILIALDDTGGPVAVILGNGHARTDWGVPSVIAFAAPYVSILSIGQVEAPAEAPQPYDRWRVTERVPRPDPCLAFQ